MLACDIAFVGGTIVDGTGSPATKADIAIVGDRILAIGDSSSWSATRSVDASGLVVAPGFVDTHAHDDVAVLDDPSLGCKTSQGVTTVITGNCGISAAPVPIDGPLPDPFPLLGARDRLRFATVDEYSAAVGARESAVNVGLFAGHTALRASVMGADLNRPADAAEISAMGNLLEQALADGCLGLSSGLDYPSAMAASEGELQALVGLLGSHRNAVYATHLRDESALVGKAIDEAVRTAMAGAAPLVISHHKVAGVDNYGRSRETLARIDAAATGHPVYLDVYPYTASSTVLLPRFLDGVERVTVASSVEHPDAAGRDLDDIAAELGTSRAEASRHLAPATAIYFQMHEEDVTRIIAHPNTMIGSDGIPATTHPHPRLWGSFPRFLGRYVREQEILGLEEAVHRITGLPAMVFGLRDRGVITEGAIADICCFDPDTVIDRATYETPTVPSAGIEHVLVAGRMVWSDGGTTDNRPGRFLSREGAG